LQSVVGFPEILWRLGAAALAGFLLGLDREFARKPAGVRTHMLIAIGSALTIAVGTEFGGLFPNSVDPNRAIQGLVSAVGFIGAGVVIQRQDSKTGLTTAAAVWMAGMIGLACGAGFYIAALTATALVLIILAPIKWLERWAERRWRQRGNPPSDVAPGPG
jgi:putative Mg2+ transporter-C (MgtC) family protein